MTTNLETTTDQQTSSDNGQQQQRQPASRSRQPTSDYPLPPALTDDDALIWDDDAPAVENYATLGQRLAATDDLYRNPDYGGGLLLASPNPNVPPTEITNGPRLAAVVVDRVRVRRIKGGKPNGSQIPSSQLATLLKSETFLQQFRPLDAVVKTPSYAPDFELLTPGYNDHGHGNRILYIGSSPTIRRTQEEICRFLDVMPFATPADRTNAAAAALTVMLRGLWPGGKPLVLVTSTKSHGGKDTTILFASGRTRQVSLTYQRTDWALEAALAEALKRDSEIGLVNIENARLGPQSQFIRSAVLERFVTDPEPMLYSSRRGHDPRRRTNQFVITISTNEGTVSEDLMNRCLPIHLAPVGNVADRQSPIGNPKLEYLPLHCDDHAAELRGMIENWKHADRPLDDDVQHPFSDWARTIGGILRVNGFEGFLENYSIRRTADDPLRRDLGLLGAERPDQWLPSSEWAKLVAELGFVKSVTPEADRDSEKGRQRGLGVVLSAHRDETFHAESEDERFALQLEKGRRRFEGGQPSTRYRFRVVDRVAIPVDEEVEEVASTSAT